MKTLILYGQLQGALAAFEHLDAQLRKRGERGIALAMSGDIDAWGAHWVRDRDGELWYCDLLTSAPMTSSATVTPDRMISARTVEQLQRALTAALDEFLTKTQVAA